MVVGALSIEVAAVVVDTAIVQRAEAHEAMLQGVVSFLVHVVMPDHVLLTCEPLPGKSTKLAGARAPSPCAKSAWIRAGPQGLLVTLKITLLRVKTAPTAQPVPSTLALGGHDSKDSEAIARAWKVHWANPEGL